METLIYITSDGEHAALINEERLIVGNTEYGQGLWVCLDRKQMCFIGSVSAFDSRRHGADVARCACNTFDWTGLREWLNDSGKPYQSGRGPMAECMTIPGTYLGYPTLSKRA